MAKTWLIVLLLWCMLLVTAVRMAKNKEAAPLRTHTIQMPFIDQDLQNRWFDFGADSVVNTNKHIRLTHDRPHESGWLWSRLPLTATNWQMDIEFKIYGAERSLHGDGMAIWLTRTRAQSGPVFGSIDFFEGLGIFFDTYGNARHAHSFPYVMAMQGDGKTSYDLSNDGKANEIGGCEADIREKEIATKARITYYKGNYLELRLQYKNWEQWEPCFTLSNVTLPTVYYLGFSALTGEVSDNHDIISVTTNNLVSIPPSKGPRRDDTFFDYAAEPSGWSGLIFFIKLIASVSFIGILVMVYRAYKNPSRF